MRGNNEEQGGIFSYLSPEQRVREDHPLRAVRAQVDAVLARMSPLFDEMYSSTGRPSIPPEKLLRALLLQMLYSIRSERMLMEQVDYSILFRWFVGLSLDDEVWNPTTFTKNRDRLLKAQVAEVFLTAVVDEARANGWASEEHFSVDGTLLEAWASLKSFRPKGQSDSAPPDDPGNPTVNFHGEKRSNVTHESTSDPESRLARKGNGKEAKLAYTGNLLIENRHGLITGALVVQSSGRAETEGAIKLLGRVPGSGRITAGGDKGYDQRGFVAQCREMNVTAHVARNERRNGGSAIDQRTTRHAGYAISQVKRKRIEECFGWMKDIALLRKLKHRGVDRVNWTFTFAAAAYNLVRMRNLRSAAQVA